MLPSTRYYVYTHEHPETGETVYVGKGTGGRAWDVTRCRGKHKDHQFWMIERMENGYVPSDWVKIVWSNLTEEIAYQKEKELLHEIGGTCFNRQSGERNYQAKLTDDQAREIFKSTELHRVLAEMYGVSRTCIHMIKSRKQWRAATACMIGQN